MEGQLLVATRNRGKLQELRELLQLGPDVELISLEDVPPVPKVVEDGATFEANARKKACETALASGLPVLADDSGLEVDALGGAPGVYSARYAGPDVSDEENNRKLLSELEGVGEAQRTARFRCVLAWAEPDGARAGQARLAHGTCEGWIAHEPRGEAGFGYDPLFVPDGYAQTLAELGSEVKGRISHRADAAVAMRRLMQGART